MFNKDSFWKIFQFIFNKKHKYFSSNLKVFLINWQKSFKNQNFSNSILNKIESDVQKEISRIKKSNLRKLAFDEPLIINQILKLFKK